MMKPIDASEPQVPPAGSAGLAAGRRRFFLPCFFLSARLSSAFASQSAVP